MSAEGATLSVDRRGEVLRATLQLGPEGLLDSASIVELTSLLEEPPPEARVLVLASDGDAFCLGRERSAADPEELRAEVRRLIRLNRALAGSRMVTVTAVQGDAAGFGVGLAALSDVAVAAPGARLWFPEVEIDLAPVVVLTWLPRVVGRRAAFDLTATGRRVEAEEALRLGLVDEVAPSAGELAAAVGRRVEGLLARSGRVHAEIKDYLRASAGLSEEQAYELALDRLVLGSMRRRQDG